MKIFAWLGLLMCAGIAGAAPGASNAPVVPVIQESRAHSDRAFAISPDEKWIVSGDAPQLWNARGELVRDLERPKFGGQTPVFARDGRRFFLTEHLALEWQDGTAVYALPSGQKIGEMAGVEVSGDGRFFIRRGEKTTRISEAARGQLLATIPMSATEASLDFSPDGKFVAVGEFPSSYRDGKMRIWSLQSGKLARTLSDERAISGPAQWSDDGKTLITMSGHKAGLGLKLDAVQVWDAETGQLRRAWTNIAVEPDNFWLRGWISSREVVLGAERDTVLDIATGRARHLEHPVSNAPQIVLRSFIFNAFELRDASGTKTLQSFPLKGFGSFYSLAYSPDGALLAASQGYDNIRIFDAHSGALLQTLRVPDEDNEIRQLQWLTDGSLSVVSASKIWDWPRAGQGLSEATTRPVDPANFPPEARISPDGKWASSYMSVPSGKRSHDLIVRLWNQKGEMTREFPIASYSNMAGMWNYYRDSVWVNGASLAVPTPAGVEVWNSEIGREAVIEKSPDAQSLTPVIVSPDGRFLLCREARGEYGHQKWRTVLLETKNWTRLAVYANSAPLAWSADSTRFVAQGNENENVATIFSPLQTKPLQKMPFHPPSRGDAGQIAFSPDLKWVAMRFGEFATHTEIHHLADNKIAVSLYLFADEKELTGDDLPPDAPLYWLALTPAGFYDGSPNIEQWLRWRRGEVLLPVGALRNERRKPERVRAALR